MFHPSKACSRRADTANTKASTTTANPAAELPGKTVSRVRHSPARTAARISRRTGWPRRIRAGMPATRRATSASGTGPSSTATGTGAGGS